MAEECAFMERIRYEAPAPPEEAYANVKGTFDLTPKELAIFRELYLLRETSAAQLDRPQFKVITNDALLTVAREPGRHFETIPNANVRWLKSVESDIDAAIRRGMEAEPIAHPSRGKRSRSPWTDESRSRWQGLNAVRGGEAKTLGISPSTLWPTRSLEQIAINPELLEQELRGTSQLGVRNWQRAQFGDILERTLREGAPAPAQP
jgi:ribonuclease D